MSGSHFNYYNTNTNESKLFNNFIDEAIEQYGIPCMYLVRQTFNEDRLFGEDPSAIFNEDNAFQIRLYPENFQDFDGSDEMYTKFGLTIDNNYTFFVQQDRIHKRIGNKPFQGDLIYVPTFNRIFELSKAEEKSSFFLFGRMTSYKLVCKLFEYSGEQLDTTIEEVDGIEGMTSVDELLTDNKSAVDTDVVATINFDESRPFGE